MSHLPAGGRADKGKTQGREPTPVASPQEGSRLYQKIFVTNQRRLSEPSLVNVLFVVYLAE